MDGEVNVRDLMKAARDPQLESLLGRRNRQISESSYRQVGLKDSSNTSWWWGLVLESPVKSGFLALGALTGP